MLPRNYLCYVEALNCQLLLFDLSKYKCDICISCHVLYQQLEQLHVLVMHLRARIINAYQEDGNVMEMMIVKMVQMKILSCVVSNLIYLLHSSCEDDVTIFVGH